MKPEISKTLQDLFRKRKDASFILDAVQTACNALEHAMQSSHLWDGYLIGIEQSMRLQEGVVKALERDIDSYEKEIDRLIKENL